MNKKTSFKVPFSSFFKDVAYELSHVTWPKLRKVGIFSVLVVLVVFIFAYFISFVDTGFLSAMRAARTAVHGKEEVNVAPTATIDPSSIKMTPVEVQGDAPVKN